MGMMKIASARSQLLLKSGRMFRYSMANFPSGDGRGAVSFATMTSRPPTCLTAKYAAAITAVILMMNWIMSMTSTPQRPEYAANTTLRSPTMSSVCQRSRPKSTLAILQAARFTEPMMTQLKKKPR